jgi:hypothetical protein
MKNVKLEHRRLIVGNAQGVIYIFISVMKKYYLIITCLLFFGCKQVSKEKAIFELDVLEDTEQIVIENLDENSILKYSDVFNSVHFVKLEVQDSSLIGRIDKIIATEDKFIILDGSIAKMVFVFDKNGLFLNRIGKIGGGPEEYDCPDDMVYDKYNDELLVWCFNDRSILRFKLDGTFIKKIKTKWWASAIAVVDKDIYLLYLNNISQEKGLPNDYNILMISKDGEVVEQMLSLDEDMKNLSPPSKNIFASYQNEILFSPHYCNRIFTIKQGKITTKYYLNFYPHNIPSSTFNNVTDRELDRIIKDRDYAFNITGMETPSHVVCQFIYKRKIFDCYYSKKTKTTKVSAMYINDMYALSSDRAFTYINDDSLISFVNPQVFVEIQAVMEQLKGRDISAKSILQKWLSSPERFIFARHLKRIYANAIKSMDDAKLTKKEIDFINSIKEMDNPVLLITTLKEF